MEYFKRSDYQEKLVSRKYFMIWREKYPEFKHIEYMKWKNYWKLIRVEFFKEILSNNAGVDLPVHMGNISIKILDKEFRGVKDFPNRGSIVDNKAVQILTPVHGSIKTASITWKKSKVFKSVPAMFGFEKGRTMKQFIREHLQETGINKYQKMAKENSPSKYKEEDKPISIFDLA